MFYKETTEGFVHFSQDKQFIIFYVLKKMLS